MLITRLSISIRSLALLACAAPLAAAAQSTIRQYQYAPRADGMAYEVVLKQVPASEAERARGARGDPRDLDQRRLRRRHARP